MSVGAYPEYKKVDSQWLDQIPAHWHISPIKRQCRLLTSNVDKHIRDDERPVALCNYTDVYYREVITGDIQFMQASASDDQIKKFALRSGDVLVTKDSEDINDIGVPAHVPETLDDVLCGYHLAIYRPRESVIGRYVKYYLESAFAAACYSLWAKGLTRVGLSKDALGRLPLSIPSLQEQRTIANFLDYETARIDALIEEQKRLIELLKEKRQAVISHAVSKGLDPDVPMKDSGVEWLGEVPAHWRVAKIRYFAKLESGHTPSRYRPDLWQNCTVDWFTLADVWQIRYEGIKVVRYTKEKISEDGIKNSGARMLPRGTVILSRTASVGYSAVMAKEMATTQDFANWICGVGLRPSFLYFVFQAMREEFNRLMVGSTHKTIYMPDIAGMMCAMPPAEEQRDIVRYIKQESRTLNKLVDEAEGMCNILRERRSALISAAVTGTIELRGWEPPERSTDAQNNTLKTAEP